MDHCLIYFSKATELFHKEELQRIADSANQLNAPMNVTGMLLYSGQHFLQVLEGNKDTLELLYKKIERDPRHENLERLMFCPVFKRTFNAWHMGALDLTQHRDFPADKFRIVADQAASDPICAGRTAFTILKMFKKELPDPFHPQSHCA